MMIVYKDNIPSYKIGTKAHKVYACSNEAPDIKPYKIGHENPYSYFTLKLNVKFISRYKL